MTEKPAEPENPRSLLVACAPRVYGLLIRMVGRRDVAEDLMQETMVHALRGLDAYRPEGKFRAWVFRIAVNQARDWVRRQKRAAGPMPGDPPTVTDVPPDRDARARERDGRVERALAQLSDPDREVLLMRYYGNLTFKAIAQANGEPIGTVLARAHRALKKLGGLLPEEI